MTNADPFYKTSGATVATDTELVLLHGWGMNADVWDGVLPALAEKQRVRAIDLPGHGRSRHYTGDYSLAAQAAAVAGIIPAKAVLVGWSMGGLIAMQLALDFPQNVESLVLVASSPRFVRSTDWPDGMDAEVLSGFARELHNDFKKTIKRFLAIQALGSEHAREELRALRESVFRHGEPDATALASGLDILRQTDFREQLPAIACPTLLLNGERDTLFPLAAAQCTQTLLPNARLGVISGAGHAPFLSHPDAFVGELQAFLKSNA